MWGYILIIMLCGLMMGLAVWVGIENYNECREHNFSRMYCALGR